MQTDSENIKLPGITDALVEALEALFPPKCPTLKQSDREIWMNAGRRAMVEYIKLQHQRNKKANLQGPSSQQLSLLGLSPLSPQSPQ